MKKRFVVNVFRDSLSWKPRKNPAGYALVFVAFFYLGILAAPDFLFGETVRVGAITVHTHSSTAGIVRDVQLAEARLALSSINDITAPQHVYLTQSPTEFRLFAPKSYHALGVSYVLLSTTYVPPSDPAVNLVTSNRPEFNRRSLSAVLAHERMHVLLSRHFGYLATFLSPAWKQEGYCEYVAGGHSIGDDATGLELLRKRTIHDPALEYFRDYRRVKYLIEQKHLNIDQVFQQSFDVAKLDRQIMNEATKQ